MTEPAGWCTDVKPTRVFLEGMPPLLHDIIYDALTNRSDIALVGDVRNGQALIDARRDGEIDVVIVGARQPDDIAAVTGVFSASPGSRILAIATSGQRAVLYQWRPEKKTLGDVSPDSLVEAIRTDL